MSENTQEDALVVRPERIKGREDLFDPEVINNRVWFHGTRRESDAESILKAGLRPVHFSSPKKDNIARRLGLSLDPRFSGHFVVFEVQEDDIATGGSARGIESSWIDPELDRLPPDRGVFAAESAPFQDVIDAVQEKVVRAMEEQGSFSEISLTDSLSEIEKLIEKYGNFNNPEDKNQQNSHRLAEAILWNEVDYEVSRVVGNTLQCLKRIREVRNEAEPDSLDDLLGLFKEKWDRATIEQIRKIPPKLRSIFRLVEIGGKVFNHPDYNYESYCDKAKLEELASWIESLQTKEGKELESRQAHKDAEEIGGIKGWFRRISGCK